MPTLAEDLALAQDHHQSGRPDEAERICLAILENHPELGQLWHLVGGMAFQRGDFDLAADRVGRALSLMPNFAAGHFDLGLILHAQRKLDLAADAYRRALALKPDYADAHNNLGNVLKDQGHLDEAIASYRRALDLQPDFAEAHNNLAAALQHQGQLDEAVACYRRAIGIQPNFEQALFNLGTALKAQAKHDDAIACFRRVILLRPDHAAAHNNLGSALREQGKLHEAMESYRHALKIAPGHAETLNNLGNALKDLGRPDDALASFLLALQQRPELPEAHSNLGNAFKAQGKLGQAIASYGRALDLAPDFAAAHSNLVFLLPFSPAYDQAAILAENLRWNQQHAEPLAPLIQPHANDPSPDRKLRVGYVSPHFRQHVQAHFTIPLLSTHDHGPFEIVCYSDVVKPDDITHRLRSHADAWCDTAALSNHQLADRIRTDQIDILVDLTMHMEGSRLLTFARKPVPVQICWLAYPGTTGLSTMDYRLTDPYLDPPGQHDADYSEQSLRLPETFWCYDPLAAEPQVNPLPALAAGRITFGSLNNFSKLNPALLKLWARVLRTVPNSQIMLLAPAGSHRQNLLEILAAEGVSSDRIAFVAHRPRHEYLALYHHIDIALDTLPANGHTTSLDAYWMGVPVVTLFGATVVGRAGLSQLTNLGLPELIASAPDEFVHIAAKLAGDLARLSNLRATLRYRLQHSPLMNAPRFARHIESAYRTIWRQWCASRNFPAA